MYRKFIVTGLLAMTALVTVGGCDNGTRIIPPITITCPNPKGCN